MTAPFSADLIPTSQWPLLLELIGVAPCVAWFVRDFFSLPLHHLLVTIFLRGPFFTFLPTRFAARADDTFILTDS
jgi:hypothetical protein